MIETINSDLEVRSYISMAERFSERLSDLVRDFPQLYDNTLSRHFFCRPLNSSKMISSLSSSVSMLFIDMSKQYACFCTISGSDMTVVCP